MQITGRQDNDCEQSTNPVTYSVTSIPEFLGIVEKCTNEWFVQEKTWGPWFRGQRDANWRLRPGLYRYPPCARHIRRLEDEIRQEFAVRAPSLGTERPQNSWELYFLMQHCGAPTRLLDWTESALVALYFAIRDKADENDAAVWILEPWKLNEHVAKLYEVIAPGASAGMVPSHVDRYKDWLPDRYSIRELLVELPVAVYPTQFSRRISSQRSCFTIHGSDFDGFDHLPEKARPYLRKIVIPGPKTAEIEKSLALAGIDEVTVYPDLDGLGRWLSMIMRDESRPTK
jgi:hypothetical protein